MKHIALIGAFTLGVTLCATSVWAAYRVINRANETIQVGCAADSSTNTINHGVGADYQCDGTFSVQRIGDQDQYSIADDCQSGQIKQTEVSILTVEGEEYLARAESCVSHSFRLPSS